MMLRSPSRVLCVATLLVAMPAFAGKKHVEKESPWDLAERAKQTLLEMPADQRKRNDYTVVMDTYRVIYHSDPGNVKAPDAIFAVAGLLADEGRTLHSEKDLQNAIGQYEFLRKQYPYSSLRIPALYLEAMIAQNDLHDSKQAKEKLELYVKKYPKGESFGDAQTALAALKSGKPLSPAPSVEAKLSAPQPVAIPKLDTKSDSDAGTSTLPAAQTTGQATSLANSRIPAANGTAAHPVFASATPVPGPQHTVAERGNKPAVLTSVRHWSTDTYTRVVIDLGEDVEYEAARVPRPDRIYFDLHHTRLSQEMVGKSFAVTDDGFLKRIRAAQYTPDITRVVLDVADVTDYSAFLLPNPYRLIIDIHGGPKSTQEQAKAPPASAVTNTQPAKEEPAPKLRAEDNLAALLKPHGNEAAAPVPSVPSTVATHTPAATREVSTIDLQPGGQKATTRPTSKPIAEVVTPQPDVEKSSHKKKTSSVDVIQPVHAAEPTLDGQRSLVRALGLKINRIVIDAGHGGHDSGTLGVGGIMEKDVVLDVALRLGKMLHERLGAEIIYTRSDDTFIPLETRTAIANKAQADLFISVHANSSSDADARGVEVYYLNFTSQPDALDVAARENAVSNQSIYQLADLVKKITLKDKIDESREFATDVDKSLFAGLQTGNAGLKNRGVKKAPFVVLIGANMPSILAEISFVTNPTDAAKLKTPEYRQRVAESLYRGVAKYTSGLSGTKVAQNQAADAGGGQ